MVKSGRGEETKNVNFRRELFFSKQIRIRMSSLRITQNTFGHFMQQNVVTEAKKILKYYCCNIKTDFYNFSEAVNISVSGMVRLNNVGGPKYMCVCVCVCS